MEGHHHSKKILHDLLEAETRLQVVGMLQETRMSQRLTDSSRQETRQLERMGTMAMKERDVMSYQVCEQVTG